MRAALLVELPALCRFYRNNPWDWDRFTYREVHEFRDRYREYIDEMSKG